MTTPEGNLRGKVNQPTETSSTTEPGLVTIAKEEIELGEAFLRRAVRQSPGISTVEALRQIGDPYLKLLCRRVAGVMPQVIKAGRTMHELISIDVVEEKDPNGITRERLKCNFAPTPKTTGRIFLEEFRREL